MQKFATATPVTAVLDIPAGRVQFIAADRADTTVVVLPANASKSRDVKAAEQTRVEYSDGVLRIDNPVKNQYFGPTGAIEVTVQLPAGFPCRGEGRQRRVARRRTARRRRLRRRPRLGQARRDRGRPSHPQRRRHLGRPPRRPRGDPHPEGDLRIAEAVRGTVELRTEAGEISIGAARGVSASLDAGTSHGRIHNALKNTDGVAGLSIRATTASGNITARSL